MKKLIRKKELNYFDYGWLQTRHHFSFGDYYDKENKGIESLRVINDDIIEINEGFGKHPHKNMEILTYVVSGELTHKDSFGNASTLKRGQIQYMSAGKGIMHAEENNGKIPTRFIQIWIYPDKNDLEPVYGDVKLKWEERYNTLLKIAGRDGIFKINQDIDIYVIYLENDTVSIKLRKNEKLYVINLEGMAESLEDKLECGDSMFTDEDIHLKALKSHLLIIKLKENS